MKYLIDVPDGTKWIEAYYPVDHFQYQGQTTIVDSLIPYAEMDRKAIEDEVWELADYMCRMGVYEKEKCFGFSSTTEVTANLSYQEAKAKFEAWMKEKDELHVGDEVFHKDYPNEKAVVTRLYESGYMCADILFPDGETDEEILVNNLSKTGRHFDEVVQLLKKIRGEEE